VESNAPLLQRFTATNEYISGSPEARKLWYERFQALPPEEQQSLVSGLTPAKDPSAAYRLPGVPSIQQETLEEGITAPSTLVPLAAGAVALPAGAALPMVGRALTRPLVEGGLQTLGEVGGQVMETGKLPSIGDVTTSLALNTLPSAAEETLRFGGRQLGRKSRGGQVHMRDEAAQRAEGLGARAFASQPEPVIEAMFNRVRGSGVKLDIGNVNSYLGTLTPDEQRLLLREVGDLNVPFANALKSSGTPGTPTIRGWDIGELQDLRSNLIKAVQSKRTPEVQDLLTRLRTEVDDAIGSGRAVGNVPEAGMGELLQQAQREYRRLRAGDELQELVTKHTGFSPNRRYQDLNLAGLSKELEGTTRAGKNMQRELGPAESTRLTQELDELAQLYPSVRISGQVGGSVTAGSVLAAGGLLASGNPLAAGASLLPGVLSAVVSSPEAMRIFRQAVISGRGEISPNAVALIASAARRELAGPPETSPRQPMAP
jgi:hypothetical protein